MSLPNKNWESCNCLRQLVYFKSQIRFFLWRRLESCFIVYLINMPPATLKTEDMFYRVYRLRFADILMRMNLFLKLPLKYKFLIVYTEDMELARGHYFTLMCYVL